ncbi:LysE family translocator [Phytoactinopolyspora halotolerans]|uniref:LysE family translocator n=1 Tax=Phytoactinopolyspora halotolerans TaxID=1981512 RepID=A0A6L9SGZ7_9ACTN|nr:LysE family translocator [Phytoactinopolyspora halotolerans]NEE04427.1 LysE family translocator [Phytoactinopolyspora halotolerans]
MWPDRWPAFVGVLVIVLCVPGPDFFVIVRYSLTGTRAGIRAAAGNVTGLMVHTTLAAVGVGALLAARPALLDAVRYAGAGYLAWLGVGALRAFLARSAKAPSMPRSAETGSAAGGAASDEQRFRSVLRSAGIRARGDGVRARGDGVRARGDGDVREVSTPPEHLDADTAPRTDGFAVHPYRDGVATNLLNPKAVLFFVGVIPQFVSPDGSVTAQTMVLAGTTLGFVVMWWAAVVFTVGRGVQPLIGPGWQRTMNGMSAAAFLVLALSFLVAPA